MVDDGPQKLFRVLALDGGGAKGFYTLGVLKEIEGMIRCPLHQRFDLVFGTSTGAIIAALVCIGTAVDDIAALYREHVVKVMAARSPTSKSAALQSLATEVFGDLDFSAVKTRIGIVATNWDFERPFIFKSDARQAYKRQGTFVPGFGVSLGDAVQRHAPLTRSSYGSWFVRAMEHLFCLPTAATARIIQPFMLSRTHRLR